MSSHIWGLYRGFRYTGYLPFHLVIFGDLEYLGKLIMGLFASLEVIVACLLQGIWDIWYPIFQPHISISKRSRLRSGSSYKSCLIWVCSVCKSIKRRLYEIKGKKQVSMTSKRCSPRQFHLFFSLKVILIPARFSCLWMTRGCYFTSNI